MSDYDQTLDVVVRSIKAEEPDSPFLLARGIGMLSLMVGLALLPAHPISVALLFAVSALASWYSAKAPPQPVQVVTRSVRVRVDPTTISYDGKTVERSAITTAVFVPRADGKPSVRCLNSKARVLFEAVVADEATANDFIRAIGHDPSHHRTRFPTSSAFGATMLRRLVTLIGGYALLGTVLFLGGSISGGALLALAFALYVLPRLLIGAGGQVDVGEDGLLVRSLGIARFVPYDSIEAVERVGILVRIRRKKGRPIILNPNTSLDGLDGAALFQRIESARGARKEPATDLATLIARGKKAVSAWRAELMRLDDVESYRKAPIRKDDLWRLVEDPSAPEEGRAAAAIALRRDDDAAARLRIAADAVASPHLRVVLEAAADPATDEEMIDEALTTLVKRADVA